MAMFEPIIKTDISVLPKKIETNLDELEAVIKEKEEFARSLVVNVDSEEELVKADADAALLTKMEKRISRFRIDWTKEWQAPFESVIAKCKDYESRLKNAAADLRGKTEIGKEKIRAAKCEKLLAVWNDKTAACGITAPHFVRFFATMTDTATTGCWLNKGVKPEAAERQMDEEIARCVTALTTIKSNYGNESEEIKQKAWLALRENFDIAEAIAAVNAYKAEQAELAEAKKRDEERKAAAMEKAKQELAEKHEAPAPAPAPAPAASVAPVPATDKVSFETYILKVTGTRAALIALKAWCAENGVTLKKA